ncbi:potassium channel subfamily K member 16-like [Myxocyprinus asiaticus]|uniref:potassium channel subfamily K member 16-like n=1 Tax=Myxocyprinus asiaticus TaxID=70543 RepID=UPI0022227115|nr:potassium channel subfamily K member 16-like [Myxocyprinus asiaticus]
MDFMEDELQPTPTVIVDVWENRVNSSRNSANPSSWDFSSSFFFAGTVVTTIDEDAGSGFVPTYGKLVIPPLIFSYIEGWSYGEGFYFAFITLSSIGFGDYAIGW